MSVMTPVLDGTARPVRRPRPTRRPVASPRVPERVATATVATAPRPATVERIAYRKYTPAPGERAWMVLAHLSGVVSSVAGPLVISRVIGERSLYVREQALAAANFQLAFLAALAPTLLLGVLTFGLAALFLVPLVLAWLLTTVLAAFSAAGGERYRYPVGLALLR
ncbi:DUF4870 domain-containing protein [Cryptosporangium aurantiacum]|uniref:Uncharacterized conserved protein, Tic20 family n=1 Tax=Cryptosporangium aurantiacum TaxID=134849 RepID=A0A1M7MXS7_9ACTN|nr:DUF4870 domain-containing protein [Cryptosporangium aurantiacum]SHM96012.1 Uncharacterized conserved protein, Tic20 family [Cryptosporangium aurantiacum]